MTSTLCLEFNEAVELMNQRDSLVKPFTNNNYYRYYIRLYVWCANKNRTITAGKSKGSIHKFLKLLERRIWSCCHRVLQSGYNYHKQLIV